MKQKPSNKIILPKKTLVSVVIPVKNRAHILKRTLDSVFAQEHINFEIIIVNDGSTDNTDIVLRDITDRIKYITNTTSKGAASARNQGAQIASGEYLAFLDSDDCWTKDHLITSLNFIKENDCDGVFGTFVLKNLINNKSEPISFATNSNIKGQIGDLILGNTRFDARTSTFFIKKECFLDIQFDHSLRKHQDWDFAIRFDEKYKFELKNSQTTIIHLDDIERMSTNLNFDASKYFIEKHLNNLSANSIFFFLLKLYWREQYSIANKTSKSYLDLMIKYSYRFSFPLKFILFLVRNRMLNVNFLSSTKRLLNGKIRFNK